MKVPVAETFHSLQGEGTWVGTPMHFIRLAGCSVGKLLSADTNYPTLPTGAPAWRCTSWDNRPFWCDTDFNKHTERDTDDLVNETTEQHICITGGEPLIHRTAVERIEELAFYKRIRVHIETSGTIFYPPARQGIWLTVAPKLGCLESMLAGADEIKLLIDDKFDLAKVPESILRKHNVFLSPVNNVEGPLSCFNNKNLQRAINILADMPHWRLSVQVHKYLGLR